MTVAFDAFLPQVLPYVRDCADLVAINAIRSASIEFCERSLWWMYEPLPIPAEIGVADYVPETPPETRMVQVYQAYYDGVLIKPVIIDNMIRAFGSDWRDLTGKPRALTQLESDTVTLYPWPDDAADLADLKLIITLAPTQNATGIDDDIYQRHIEAIASGARARLHENVGAPYFDAAAAQALAKRFRHQTNQAAIARIRSLGRTTQVLRPPVFI